MNKKKKKLFFRSVFFDRFFPPRDIFLVIPVCLSLSLSVLKNYTIYILYIHDKCYYDRAIDNVVRTK